MILSLNNLITFIFIKKECKRTDWPLILEIHVVHKAKKNGIQVIGIHQIIHWFEMESNEGNEITTETNLVPCRWKTHKKYLSISKENKLAKTKYLKMLNPSPSPNIGFTVNKPMTFIKQLGCTQ